MVDIVMTDCPLCKIPTTQYSVHEDDICRVVICKSCKVPMAVLNRHVKIPTGEELTHIKSVLTKLGKRFVGVLDDSMSTIKGHYHMHLRTNPILPITTIPYKVGSSELLKPMWRRWVLRRRFEGLVITEQRGSLYRITKVKTWMNIDAVIIAVDTTGKTWEKGIFGSLYLGLMDNKGRIVEIGKMSGGDNSWKAVMRKKLEKDKLSVFQGKMYVKPRHVVQVRFMETAPTHKRQMWFALKKNGSIKQISIPREYRDIEPFTIRAGLKFVRDRPDKKVSWRDIRIEQIPEFFGRTGREYLLSKMRRIK